MSAPDATNSSTRCSGRSTIRWTSRMPSRPWTRSWIEAATIAPIEIGGTKWPSITSTWITRAPASITCATCSPRREKSAARMEGATRRSTASGLRTPPPLLRPRPLLRVRPDLGQDPLEARLRVAVHEVHGRRHGGVHRRDLGVQRVGHGAVGGMALAPRAQLDHVHRLTRVHVEHVADPVAEAERVRGQLAPTRRDDALVLRPRALEPLAVGAGHAGVLELLRHARPELRPERLPLHGQHPVALQVAERAVVRDDLEPVAQRLEPPSRPVPAGSTA